MVSMPTKRVDGEDSYRSMGSECMRKLDGVFSRAGRKISNKERLHNRFVWIKEFTGYPIARAAYNYS